MQSEFFKTQIERLRGVYSEGALTPERIDLWWKKFRHEPNGVFENAMNHIIAESTSKQLPAMSRVSEAMGFFRTSPTGTSMQILPAANDCEVCRDFGYMFRGFVVVKCPTCRRGREIGPDALARAQKSYDRGRKIFRSPFDTDLATRAPSAGSVFHELPYDPGERIVDVDF